MKAILLLLLLLLLSVISYAVNNVFDGSTDANWGTASNWSQNSVPTATDGFVTCFDATSPNCTVNASNRVCNALDFTGYTNTITMTLGITVSGNVTLSPTMIISGTGFLYMASVTSQITTNNKLWNGNFQFQGGSVTYTIVDTLKVGGTFYYGLSTTNTTINGVVLVSGSVQNNVTSGYVTGGTIIMNGTGTWSMPNVTTGSVRQNMIFNTAGTITISGTIRQLNGSITYTSGTMVTTGSTINIGGICPLNLNGITLNNLNIGITQATVTLSSGFNVSGLLSTSDANVHSTMLSSVGGTKRAVTLLSTATQDVGMLDFTDIDCSGGQTISAFRGVITNCTNIRLITGKTTRSYTY